MTRIILVDDNEQNLYMLRVLLEGYGYEIESARNGAEALQIARNNPPDVIVSDILMPVMDGFALCREWVQDQKFKSIPFIFYSATYTDPRDIEFALSLGAKRFIIKPAEPVLFLEKLHQVLENHQAGKLPPTDKPLEKDDIYLKEYNQVLIRKLEDKMVQLERANKALERDISARIKAEKETKLAYMELDQIFNSSAHGMFVVDPEANILRVNDKFINLCGIEKEFVLGFKCYDIFPDPTCHTEDCPLKRIIKGENHYEQETKKQRIDGNKIHCIVTATPLKDQDDLIKGVVLDLKDISKQVVVRQEREQRFKQLSALSKVSQVVTSSLNLEQVLLEIISLAGEVVNSDFTSVVLVDEKGFYDVSTENLPIDVAIQYRLRPKGITQHIIQTRQPVIVNEIDENNLMNPYPGNGAPRYANPDVSKTGVKSFAGLPLIFKDRLHGVLFLHSNNPYTFQDQMPILTITANQAAIAIENARLFQQAQEEINERITAENAIKQQLIRIQILNEIVRAITERQDLTSIYRVVLKQVVDKFGVDHAVAFTFNPATETLIVSLQSSKDDLSFISCLPDGRSISKGEAGVGFLDNVPKYFSDLLNSDSPIAQEIAKEGVCSSFVVTLGAQENIFGALAFCSQRVDAFSQGERDFLTTLSEHVTLAARQAQLFTDLQVAYDEIRQTQQAVMQQERLRALGQMASGIAHDVNNALAVAILYIDLLLRDDRLDSYIRDKLGIIHTSAKDISKIVERMRAFYRQRDEREPFQLVDLNAIVKQVVDLTQPRWKDIPQSRGVMIETSLDLQDDLPSILCLEYEIREALTNLIFNAVDALPAGGQIKLKTRIYKATSQGKMETAWIICEVQDNGIGMDKETLRRCFEPFYTTKGEMGTGLGLAAVYGIMQRHEGRIEVESELGNGTILRLLFPFPIKVQETAVSQEARIEIPPLHILIVDDEPLLRLALNETLSSAGHRVEIADGGQKGLEEFQRGLDLDDPYDIVITDLGMPYVDGRKVTRQVKSISPTTPVILLTGWGSRMQAEGNIPLEVDYVLGKPPTLEQLQRALQTVTR